MTSADDGWGELGQLRGGHAVLARTTDGGRTWHPVSLPRVCRHSGLPSGATLSDAWLASSTVHGARSRSTVRVCHSTDRGATWHVRAGFDAVGEGGTPQFVDDHHGWLVTGQAEGMHSASVIQLYRTVDGGRDWTEVAAQGSVIGDPSFGGLPAACGAQVTFTDPTTGWYAGGCSQGGGAGEQPHGWAPYVAVTHDGGSSWQPVDLPHPGVGKAGRAGCRAGEACGYSIVYLKGPTVELYAGGAGMGTAAFYRSTDGGASWQVRALPTFTVPGTADGRHLLQLDQSHPTVYVSDDGGRNWRRLLTNLPRPAVEGPYMASSATAYAFLTHDRPLYRTADGGRRWTPVLLRLHREDQP